MNYWTFIFASAAGLFVPLVLAALGELISERSGVINIGLGGMMTAGAYFGFLVTAKTDSAALGILVAALAGAATAGIMVLVSVWRNANQILTGFAIFIMVPAVCDYLDTQRTSTLTSQSVGPIRIPALSSIPMIGKALFDQNILFYGTVIAIPIVIFLVERTYWGLRLTAAGHAPQVTLSKGVSVFRTRAVAVLICGGMAGLGGATLTVGVLGSYTPGQVAGDGFIALAIVILGRWHVGMTVLATVLLAFVDALQLREAATSSLAPEFLDSLPWIIAFIALFFGTRRGTRAPGALMSPTPHLS